jgi:hypothetical protein
MPCRHIAGKISNTPATIRKSRRYGLKTNGLPLPLQNTANKAAKDRILHAQRPHIAMRKATYCKPHDFNTPKH